MFRKRAEKILKVETLEDGDDNHEDDIWNNLEHSAMQILKATGLQLCCRETKFRSWVGKTMAKTTSCPSIERLLFLKCWKRGIKRLLTSREKGRIEVMKINWISVRDLKSSWQHEKSERAQDQKNTQVEILLAEKVRAWPSEKEAEIFKQLESLFQLNHTVVSFLQLPFDG